MGDIEHREDEGELEFKIYNREHHVVIDWGKPVVWVGMHPKEARQIAQALLKHADQLEGKG